MSISSHWTVRLVIHPCFLLQTHYSFTSQMFYMLVLLFLLCFGLLRGDSCPSADVRGWKKSRVSKASSFCIFWWRLVLWQMCWYTVEIRRDTGERERPRESPQDSWVTLSSNPSTFQRHNSPPLFTSISTSAYFSSLTPHCRLPTLNLFHPLSVHLTPLFSPPIDSASLPPSLVQHPARLPQIFILQKRPSHKFARWYDL